MRPGTGDTLRTGAEPHQGSSPVQRTTVGTVAVITLMNPPVNALAHPVRTALAAELDKADRDPQISAVVLCGANGRFSAGADLAEFDSGLGLTEPSLHDTILQIMDGMSKPIVAAIAGVALGGGLELTMGCHYRVVHASARLGLPESTFGFIPGAGGTQRLPRAIGLERALNMIITGEVVTGLELADTHLVDLLVTEDLEETAVKFAQEIAAVRPLPRLRDKHIEHEQLEAYLAFATRSIASSKGRHIGAMAAVEAIAAGASESAFDRGIVVESKLFGELANGSPARAARYQFFANKDAGRLESLKGIAPSEIASTAVIGAGTMGRGIALALLGADLPVILVDANAAALATTLQLIHDQLDRDASRGRATVDEATLRHTLISGTANIADAADADLVIEAVFENLEVKKAVFTALDAVMKPGAVLATNTSSLDVDAIAASTGRPGDVVGMHFFSPANIMRLLEVVRATETSETSLATALSLAKRLKKVAVVARNADGFIGNRIIDSYTRQAMQLLAEGALPEQVDAALEAWGLRMGPFRVLDLVGNDIPAQARAARATVGDRDWAIADDLVARGFLGQKTGRGWYRYNEKGQGAPNPEIAELIRAHAETAGARSRVFTPQEIVERCVYALVNESARVLADGVAERASDIDVAMVHGYGFPAERGGPAFFADLTGLRNVVRVMRRFQATVPSRPELWEPHPLIVGLAEANKPFSQWRNNLA